MQSLPEKPDELYPVMECFQHSSLGKIIQKAKWLLALDRCVQTLLPEALAKACRVMNVQQSTLILGVNSAALATRIRLDSETLLHELHKTEFSMIKSIECRVSCN